MTPHSPRGRDFIHRLSQKKWQFEDGYYFQAREDLNFQM